MISLHRIQRRRERESCKITENEITETPKHGTCVKEINCDDR